jgi:hypothetical protein
MLCSHPLKHLSDFSGSLKRRYMMSLTEYDLKALDGMSIDELRDSLEEMLIRYRIMKIRVNHLEQVIKDLIGGKVLAE